MKLFKNGKTENLKIQNRKLSESLLKEYSGMPIDSVLEKLETGLQGISQEEAEKRQEEDGLNIITSGKSNSSLIRLKEAIINPFNIVLIIIAAITFFTDVVLSYRPDYLTISIILALVVVSSLVAFIQSERSNAAAAGLSKMISNKVDVIRDGKLIEILLEEVVKGDIVKLSAGDIIPADIRFISAKDAFVAQSALTGESNPVEKFKDLKSAAEASLTDLSNIGFMGSNMVSGSATAVVLSIGNETYFGSMAESLSGNRAKNSFERGVDSVSSLLIKFMLIMIPAIFIINGITKGDWISSLLFAISIAVGLTPEMLPVIMTSTLAKGAINMSKHEVIVKSLGSIQSFGEMDILCTDKTGTLTEDKIILEKYMNSHGEDDLRVLRHGFLNSYFQTGLKNLIDLAIINRAHENELDSLKESYKIIDEIPFDFSRRRMSVVLEDKNGKRQLITKGAVEEIIAICSYAEYNGEVSPLSEEIKNDALRTYEKHNAEGLRMIAVAQKNHVPDTNTFSVAHESDMVLLGFIGFLDPPKESAKSAVTALKQHGVRTVVLTGDSEGVAVKVCNKVGIDVSNRLSGKDVSEMTDTALLNAVKTCNLFSKLSPIEKQRVVKAFQENGHTVGYMGDGINDAPALHQADVGISVDSAVDIAKETADIILLKKDLMVLEEGVIEGRKTFGNITKYIKMAVSGNFSNMLSVVAASIFLPFLPMLPVQILVQNLLCDFSQLGMPFDSVDEEYIEMPRKWETSSILSFMMTMGPLGSLFDILCFGIMWYVIGANTKELSPLFQCGWFVFGTTSQIIIIHMIRTAKIPFIQSRASMPLVVSTALVTIAAIFIGFTNIAVGIDMMRLPLTFAPWLILILLSYCVAVQLIKKAYIRRFGQWF